jgi:hypothetical protein
VAALDDPVSSEASFESKHCLGVIAVVGFLIQSFA